MMVYTVTRGSGNDSPEMTIHVEGKVTSGNWEALREFCLDALKNSDRLVLNLENVSDYDFSLSIFICLLRKTILLMGKHLTIRGRQDEFVCLYSNRTPCSFPNEGSHCLCENLFTRRRAS
jgi:anti-anti-sigma regulatory factor